ncbi:MAG: molybdate ABC transporter substrate-binding protein [Chlorobi bacterium]|nr:molybdate ABC transporter substrate-binding protein [Chlorobiota bacterium]
MCTKDKIKYKKKINIFFFIIAIFVVIISCKKEKSSILVYAGSASKPATEEIAQKFEKENNVRVNLIFGGSGYVLSQMILSQKGDIFFPGSSDFMEIAKQKMVIIDSTEKKVAYMIPSINVPKGNPKHIKGLKDLCKPNLRIAIANPENVCVGTYAVEIAENNLNPGELKQFRENIVNYTASCSKTAATISLNMVDAVLGWRVFHYWNPQQIDNVALDTSQISRIGYIPIAISVFSKKQKMAQQFIDFILSENGEKIFKKYHYIIKKEEAYKYAGYNKAVGGIYHLPERWAE